ncbi:hypothetical protein D7Y05_09390 [bacterium 1XD42-54]|nr:hypothetical protein D7Y05_09390 [bacterium 1XD42-54]
MNSTNRTENGSSRTEYKLCGCFVFQEKAVRRKREKCLLTNVCSGAIIIAQKEQTFEKEGRVDG